MNKKIMTQQLLASILWLLSICIVTICFASVAHARNQLEDISFASIPGNKVQVVLHFNKPAPSPQVFIIDNPARIALDLPETDLVLQKRRQTIGIGHVNTIASVSSGERSRVVLSLNSLTSYKTQVDGNNIVITLNESSSSAPIVSSPKKTASNNQVAQTKAAPVSNPAVAVQSTPVKAYSNKPHITDVDFRLGGDNEGNIILSFSTQPNSVNLKQSSNKLIVEINGMELPDELERRLDVKDFGTPVTFVDTMRSGKKVKMLIDTKGEFEHMGYQTGLTYTIEVKGLTKEEKEKIQKAKFGYIGERLSLNFQDIEVRAVLQLIADFTGKNIVVDDTVTGSITLRLKNVPWDQALAVILKTKELAKREEGNVMRIAPAEKIAAAEKAEALASQTISELMPFVTEIIELSYMPADDVVTILQGLTDTIGFGGGDSSRGDGAGRARLSNRKLSSGYGVGFSDDSYQFSETSSVIADKRSNSLIIRDTAKNIENLRKLLKELDKPTKQVLIDARIVMASNSFSNDIGLNWSVSSSKTDRTTGGQTTAEGKLGFDGRAYGVLGMAFALLNSSYLVDLEISASQEEGTSELISSPRVVTSNGLKAKIASGHQIPYKAIGDDGANTEFAEATLSLEVTPKIIPGNKVNMEMVITKDSVDQAINTEGAGPAIQTNEIETNLVVDNGDTVVLGGIFEHNISNRASSIPILGDIPVIGSAFRVNKSLDGKKELIIFVTPKVMSEAITVLQ